MIAQFLKKARKYRLLLALLAISTYAFLSLSFTDNYFEISKNLDIYSTTLKELDMYYVDSINTGELVKTSIDAMLNSLDPYTNYIPESQIEDYRFMTTGEYGGIGALVQKDSNFVEIAEPYQGSPAMKSGLMAGDKIISVDGISTEGKNTDDVGKLLKGQAGTVVKLMVLEPDAKTPIEKIITREVIKVDNVPYYGMVSDDIGYIKLTEFTENAAANVKNALVELKKNPHLKGLILDLRGNPGGLLNEAVKIVNIFEPKGQLVVNTRGRSKEWNQHPDLTPGDPVDTNIRIAVLVNGGSASASEIVTGTVQDLDRGVVIGTRTFGKGLVQQTHMLSYNSELKFTIAKYYTPSGRCIQALDYSHRNADGSVNKVADSLKSAFRTKHGRVVYDGGGIAPDITLDAPKATAVSINLQTQFLIFDYATMFRMSHASIAMPDSFSLSDEEYNKFVDYVKSRNFTYTTKSDQLLKELKETTQNENYDGDLKNSYEKIQKDIDEEKKKDLVKNKQQIKKLLEEEIESRYYYQKGRILVSMKYDEQIKKGIKVLNDTPVYDSVLTTIAQSTRPFFNSSMKTWPPAPQGK
jgi:carboxyl-terminal processing protease